MVAWLETFFDRFFELFVPSTCLSCQYESRELVCPGCLHKIEKIKIQTAGTVQSYGPYEGILKGLISQFKYAQKPGLSKPLASLLIEILPRQIDGIVPVPLHPHKLKERRYNQAALLSEELSRKLKKPCFLDGLIKETDTDSQTQLSKSAREKNVKGVFSFNPKYNLKSYQILLVDDVYTTGATLKECERMLLKHGVKKVYSVTLAQQLLT